jgi:hypothetical protein
MLKGEGGCGSSLLLGNCTVMFALLVCFEPNEQFFFSYWPLSLLPVTGLHLALTAFSNEVYFTVTLDLHFCDSHF